MKRDCYSDCFFSRRFMKWNATIIKTFFKSTRTDQNGSSQVLWWQIAPFGLASWTKKGFPRNIQYRARLKGPLFNFYAIVWRFSKNFLSSKAPLHFFDARRQKGCWKIPKGFPFSFFQHCETFRKKTTPKGPPSTFWCFRKSPAF